MRKYKIVLFIISVSVVVSLFAITSFAADPINNQSIVYDVGGQLYFYDFEFTDGDTWADYVFSRQNKDLVFTFGTGYTNTDLGFFVIPVLFNGRQLYYNQWDTSTLVPVYSEDVIDPNVEYVLRNPDFTESDIYLDLGNSEYRFLSSDVNLKYIFGSDMQSLGVGISRYYDIGYTLYYGGETQHYDGLYFAYSLHVDTPRCFVAPYYYYNDSIVVRSDLMLDFLNSVAVLSFDDVEQPQSANFIRFLNSNGVWFDSGSSEYQLYYDMGYSDGYARGDSDGYDRGLEVGYDRGYESGYNYGYSYGHNIGYGVGLTEGYDRGYEAGVLVGDDTAYQDGFDDGVAAADGDSFFRNFFTNILSGLDALTIIGGFSVLDVIKTICGLFVTIWILKLIAGG